MQPTFGEEIKKPRIMTYKIKSLAYLVAFVAIAFTYHITDSQTENKTYTETAELLQTNTNNTISTTAVEIQEIK